ncbi:MAG TPA: hypothetical protein VLH84_02430 [Patescibacteria group bacterium]|nr:hypothetical protein [Patescibacteria group bacterium]
MPPRPRKPIKELLEELGLLVETEQPNPYKELGIDAEAARRLLREDPTGATLRGFAATISNYLMPRYHSDTRGKVNDERAADERFRAIDAARKRISGARPGVLQGWIGAKGASAPSQQNTIQQRQLQAVAGLAAALVQQNMELGRHPQHFAQTEWAQGVLATRGASVLLVREAEGGGLRVSRGEASTQGQSQKPLPGTQAGDFQRFLDRNRSFGLEPGRNITTYVDETGRASVLNPDMSFIMDISDPVARYRGMRNQIYEPNERGAADAWARSADPVMLMAQVPGPDSLDGPESQVVFFPRRLGTSRSGRSLVWDLPTLVVAGTVRDEDFYRRVRNTRRAGAVAIQGTGTQTGAYFGMAAVPMLQIIEQSGEYSPLVAPGGSLLLYDHASEMPVATDTRVVGMIGSGSAY